jgi:ABC-type nitrate/sulfonate/bicarbonate transport system substrate-binding protein
MQLGKGRLRVMGSNRNVPGVRGQIYLLVARAYAERNGEAVRRLLRAWREANEFRAYNPSRVLEIYRAVTRVSAEEAQATIGFYEPVLTLVGLDELHDVARWLLSIGAIREMPDLRRIVRTDFLRSALGD